MLSTKGDFNLINFKENGIRHFSSILFLIFICQNSSYGQISDNYRVKNNAVTVEVIGHSRSLFSVNYERILKFRLDYLSATIRTGVGYTPWVNTGSGKQRKGTVTVPAVFNLLVGTRKHYAQVGFGYSASFGQDFIDSTTTTPTIYQKFEPAFIISLGYRYMWNDFVGQIYPLLQWTNNPSAKFSIGGGLSLGITF